MSIVKFRFVELFQITTAPVILRSEATKDPHLIEHPQYRRGFLASLRNDSGRTILLDKLEFERLKSF